MTKKTIIVAAVLLLAAALFVGAGAATDVSDAEALKTAVNNGEDIKLTADITLTETLKIDKETTLDLNGYVLQGKSTSYSDNYVLISVSNELTLIDSKSNEKPKYFEYAYEEYNSDYHYSTYLWKYIPSAMPGDEDVVFLINKFSRDEANNALTEGKKVYVSFTNGAITSTDTDKPKTMGICVKDGGKFTMNDGAIVGFCTLGKTGSANPAGVSVEKGAEFIMNNGYISGNAGTHGSAVVVKGTFILNDGTISGNTATRGAGVELSDDAAKFQMNGGIITENFGSAGGAGVSNVGGTLTITGGEIKNCTTGTGSGSSPTGGAAVYCSFSSGAVTITGGKIGENCKLGSGHVGAAVLTNDNTGTYKKTFGGTAVFATDVYLSGSKADAENTEINGGSFEALNVEGSLKGKKFITSGVFNVHDFTTLKNVLDAVKPQTDPSAIDVKLVTDITIPEGEKVTIPAGFTMETGEQKVDINGELLVEGKFIGKIGKLSGETLIIKKAGQVVATFTSLENVKEGIVLEADSVLTISDDDTTTTINQVLEKVKSAGKNAVIVKDGESSGNNAVAFTENYDSTTTEEKPQIIEIYVDPTKPTKPDGGSTVIGLGVAVQYEITIPTAVTLSSSTAVSDTYGITMKRKAGAGTEKVVMRLSSTAHPTDTDIFNVEDSASHSIAYSVKTGETEVTELDAVIVECDATGDTNSANVTFQITGDISYAGTYTDTLTFSVGVEPAN